ncbi:succinylglutamate desuccinylase/aspartoacylase family protein [Vibrio genomosp. F10 str. 9ZC157]|uniref:Succinylglutamate desuccinylase n=1 Tax=Vibrio genomosp. F10 str. ZF-129 TaxID=1187848 RepID=A0A1E5BE61_9VIBR|nr:succinylglutamate desuccinylase/aspartoacylase family protein [Vibrio genomosp. F10]OEE33790.1 succinylglutamate desuccinylase [Vibrio genomosp. F10 str. ZF-129]OEE96264.1 succinylglutamate desuccinylase [Vibrio genomosp. F10 str. 9ZC157]
MHTLRIGEFEILPGEQRKIELPVAKLYTDANVSLPVYIIRAKKPGPTIFISAAVHGDELNGIEIIRRLISQRKFKLTRGTVIAVPMVNVYGVVNQSRYMPDRRDLNRCFPGSAKGSLAGRVAHIFLNEIVKHCDYGIDLHTGAINRSNLPQIRANLSDPETKELALEFGVPVVLNSNIIDGSLRESAVKNQTKVLLYEAGEALRFDEFSIRAGMKGIVNVLKHLGMLRRSARSKKLKKEPFIANGSQWLRANASGIVNHKVDLGEQVVKGDVLADIGSPYGDIIDKVIASRSGIIIGQQNIPLVQEGEAMFHIAYFSEDDEDIAEHIENVIDDLIPTKEG